MDRNGLSGNFWISLVALAAPTAAVLGTFAYIHTIPWTSAVAGIAAAGLATAFLLARHLRLLRRHAHRLDELAKGEPPDAMALSADEGPTAPLAEAVARLERALPERVQPMASEAALESIVDALPYAIFQIDADEHIARANTAARRWLSCNFNGDKPTTASSLPSTRRRFFSATLRSSKANGTRGAASYSHELNPIRRRS
jgi:PAS domain-containing protein